MRTPVEIFSGAVPAARTVRKRTMLDRLAEVAICVAGMVVIGGVTSYQLRYGDATLAAPHAPANVVATR